MSPLSVAAGGAGTDASVQAAIATLPVSFRLTTGTADVQVVDGGVADWTSTAETAARCGARGVLILRPGLADPKEVRTLGALTAALRIPVVLAETWASNPALPPFATEQSAGRAVLVESVATLDASVEQTLLAQVRLLRSALSATVIVDTVVHTDSGYVITGGLLRGGRREPLILVGARTDRGQVAARVRRLTSTGESSISVYDGDIARPARARCADMLGERGLPLIYESGFRSSWRALAQLLLSGTGRGDDLSTFADDIEVSGMADDDHSSHRTGIKGS
ncbi:MAG: hypothetical protein JWM76_4268 [Pseudonocardiales bacterium]|nr:hypothetical protein [Pseudonocardiales bacterium]